MTMTIHSPEARGTATALWKGTGDAVRTEAALALLVADQLRNLRDGQQFTALGARSLTALIDARLPSLDRVSARRLLLIGDAIAALDPALRSEVHHLSLSRLAFWSTVPADDRAAVLTDAKMLPLHELRRQYPGPAELPRRDAFLPAVAVPASPPQAAVAELMVGEISRGWGQLTVAAFAAGRLLARIRDENLWRATREYESIEEAAAAELELSPGEVRRSLELVDRLTVIDDALREQLGIGALRALAGVEDDERRISLLTEARAGGWGAEAALSAVRGRRRRAETDPEVNEAVTGMPINDRAALPFNVIYLPEPTVKSDFVDATPDALIEQIVLRTTRPGQLICDLTAGAGSLGRVATEMSRSVVGYDILDPALHPDVRIGDARNVSPPEAPFSLVVFHPPVLGEVIYSDRYGAHESAADLSTLREPAFLSAVAEIMANAQRMLRGDGTLAVISREGRLGGRLIDWPSELLGIASQTGLVLHDRLYAVSPPSVRSDVERVGGFRAMRENHSLPVMTSVLLLRRGEEHR